MCLIAPCLRCDDEGEEESKNIRHAHSARYLLTLDVSIVRLSSLTGNCYLLPQRGERQNADANVSPPAELAELELQVNRENGERRKKKCACNAFSFASFARGGVRKRKKPVQTGQTEIDEAEGVDEADICFNSISGTCKI